MDPYFPIIFTQNMLLCFVTSVFIRRNTILNRKEKIIFHLTLAMGLLIAVCEYVYTATEGKPEYIWLQSLANYTSLSFTPLLPAIPILTISTSRITRTLSLVPVGINLIFLYSGHLFTIDTQGNYSRDPMFWIFMASYLANMLYLTLESLRFSIHHQNHNAEGLIFISLFMISSTTIQLRLPQIHFSWFCVTVTTLLYFFYYTDVVQQMDPLTGLLNRSSFRDYSIRFRKKIHGVILVDFDDFKNINDSYGHLVGDRYLSVFGDYIRKNFWNSGNCYRMGGDEFCILVTKEREDFLIKNSMDILEEHCHTTKDLPAPFSFSYGYQTMTETMPIAEAMELADQALYAAKSIKKQKKNKLVQYNFEK